MSAEGPWYYDLEEWAQRLDGARRTSQGLKARCPAHEDKNPSLSVDIRNGRVVWHCHAGCSQDAVRDAAERPNGAPPVARPAVPPAREVRQEVFLVKDKVGRPIAKHTRVDYSDGSKKFFWPRGTDVAGLPLYGVEHLASLDVAQPVIVTEGERKADLLRAVGFAAVGLVGGASVEPADEVLADLVGRHAVLWPDNDEPGRRCMARIAARLHGRAASVRTVDWPEAPPKGDAADLLALHPDPEAARRAVEALLVAAVPFAPVTAEGASFRTLADIDDAPPGPLLFGMLEPNGPNLAYGAPGVGKGTTGAWLVCAALAAGMRPLIFDAERRPREWSRRVSGLGGDRSRVAYLAPEDLGPKLAGRPLWENDQAIGAVAKAAGADILIVDSILPACGVGEERLRSDAQVPYLWVAALDGLGLPSLSFGHPPKGQPEGEPFGSFAWVGAMRLTWLGTRAEGDGHRIRWRPRKRNERGHIAGVLLTVTYGEDGRPSGVVREDDEESTRDWLLAGLVHGPRSVAELAEDLLADLDSPPAGELDRAKERLAAALNRMRKQGWVERLGTSGRNVRWQLRTREDRP
jgi:hypothetical protein